MSAALSATNWNPSWRSFAVSGNPSDIIDSPTVGNAIAKKVDAEGGQSSNLLLLEAYLRITGGDFTRTLEATFLDRLSVKMFGAVGDGATDDTAAIQAAISYAQQLLCGARIYFPPGQYRTSAGLLVSKPHISLFGEGRASQIIPYGNFDTITINGGPGGPASMYRNDVSHLYFNEINKTGGWCFVAKEFAESNFTYLTFDNPYNGIWVHHYNAITMEQIVVQGGIRQDQGMRLWVTSPTNTTSDVLTIRDFGMGGTAPTDGSANPITSHGIVIDGWCNTVCIYKAYATCIEGHGYWLRNTVGAVQGPGYIQFEGIESDFNAAAALQIDTVAGMHIAKPGLEDSWAAPNIYIGAAAKGVSIYGGTSNDAGQEGIVIMGQRVSIAATQIYSNSRASRGGTTNTYDGIAVGATARDVSIAAVLSGPGNNTQRYGLSIANGARNITAVGNNLTSNATGGVLNNAGANDNVVVANNIQ